MNRSTRTILSTVAAAAAALALGGCASPHLSADFGQAVRQNIAAQVANPDAKFAGTMAPGSNGARVAAAQAVLDHISSPACAAIKQRQGMAQPSSRS